MQQARDSTVLRISELLTVWQSFITAKVQMSRMVMLLIVWAKKPFRRRIWLGPISNLLKILRIHFQLDTLISTPGVLRRGSTHNNWRLFRLLSISHAQYNRTESNLVKLFNNGQKIVTIIKGASAGQCGMSTFHDFDGIKYEFDGKLGKETLPQTLIRIKFN